MPHYYKQCSCRRGAHSLHMLASAALQKQKDQQQYGSQLIAALETRRSKSSTTPTAPQMVAAVRQWEGET